MVSVCVCVCAHVCECYFLPWPSTHTDICTYVHTYACTCVHVCTHLQTFTHKEAFKRGRSHNSVLEVITRWGFSLPLSMLFINKICLRPLGVRWAFATDLAKSHRICSAWVPQISNFLLLKCLWIAWSMQKLPHKHLCSLVVLILIYVVQSCLSKENYIAQIFLT